MTDLLTLSAIVVVVLGVGVGSLLWLHRRRAPVEVVVSVRDRLPKVERPPDAPADRAVEPVIGNRSNRRHRVPAEQLPADPWGLEADRSVAPLIVKRQRLADPDVEHEEPRRLAGPNA